MKKRVLFVTAMVMFICTLQAQITITAADMPNIGDTIRLSQASPQSVSAYNFAATGTNHTWNFSNMTAVSQDIDTFVSVISTPLFYYPSFITNASIAKKGPAMGGMGFSLTNVYEFYKETSTYFSQVGFAAQLNGVPLPTLFSAPDYIYRFPLTYGGSDSCNFGYSIIIPGLFSYVNQSKRVNIVDGWGTLTTPFGTFQTVRIKSTVTSRDSIASDSLPFPVPPVTTTTTEYKWLANGYRAPLLTVSADGFFTTAIYMDSIRPFTGIEEPYSSATSGYNFAVNIFPNPARSIISITPDIAVNGQPMQVTLFDATGRVIMKSEFNTETGIIDISELSPGIYNLLLNRKDGASGTAKVLKI